MVLSFVLMSWSGWAIAMVFFLANRISSLPFVVTLCVTVPFLISAIILHLLTYVMDLGSALAIVYVGSMIICPLVCRLSWRGARRKGEAWFRFEE
jgi:hypothetical protein